MSETNLSVEAGEKCLVPWLVYEDLSEMLNVISAIPDGIRLANFPSHLDGADCWCRPKVSFRIDELVVDHKDLSLGDFDS